MQRIFATLFLTLLAALSPAAAETIRLKHGLPTDIWITWPDGERLGEPGLVEVFPEYRQVYKGGEFKLVKDAGFDFVRLTIDPAVFLWQPTPGKTKKLIAGMKTAIAEIRAEGLKVIVDMHSIPRDEGGMGTVQILANNETFARYLPVVETVGRALNGLPPGEVAFEILNEPTIDCVDEMPDGAEPRWPALLPKLHATARKAAPDLTLVLSGACWGGADGLTALDPSTIQDENVIWSFHNYDPFVFTHQEATWTHWYVEYVSGLKFPPDASQKKKIVSEVRRAVRAAKLKSATQKNWLASAEDDFNAYFEKGWAETRAREPFEKVSAWAKTHNIPPERILLGEFGATRNEKKPTARAESRHAYYGLISKEADERGFAWSTWSWSGTMGVSQTLAGRGFDPEMLKALGLKP